MATKKYILLTSENFIRANANINDETHGKYLQAAMREAQDINLQSVIGTRLMRKLQEMVSGNTIDDAGNEIYKECLDKCQYYLLYTTVARLVPLTSLHISNFGLNKPTDENMESMRLPDIFQMEKYYIDKADHYLLELQNWLIENHSDLPELTANKVSQIQSNLYSAASCGLNLGGARGRGVWRYPRNRYMLYDFPN